jgi:hypothetical protein
MSFTFHIVAVHVHERTDWHFTPSLIALVSPQTFYCNECQILLLPLTICYRRAALVLYVTES